MARLRVPQLLAAAALNLACQAFAVPLIDTSAGLSTLLGPFGEFDTATYGQTFTVSGPQTRLDAFEFRFDDELDPGFVGFAAYLYAWDGSKATGAQLYASGRRTSTDNGGAGGMELFSFATGGIELVAGQRYLAFLSASEFFDGVQGTATWEFGEGYAGGDMVFTSNGADFGALTASAWDCADGCLGGDTFFRASFSAPQALPSPGSLSLTLLGIAALAGPRRSRRPNDGRRQQMTCIE